MCASVTEGLGRCRAGVQGLSPFTKGILARNLCMGGQWSKEATFSFSLDELELGLDETKENLGDHFMVPFISGEQSYLKE